MRMHATLRTLLILPLLAALSACGDDAADGFQSSSSPPSDPAVDPDAPRMPLGTSLFLDVTDPAGDPISRARVTLPLPTAPGGPPEGATPLRSHDQHLVQPLVTRADRLEYRTDSAGHLLLEELEQHLGDRLVARVEAQGYAPASVVLEGVTPDAHMAARVILVPVARTVPFDARTGAVVAHAGVRVEIPAGGVVDDRGDPIDGLVELSLVPFDSTTRALEQPGPLTAARADGSAAQLESLVMAEVSLWHDGAPARLAPGARARVELPLPSTALASDPGRTLKIGDTIPAWWLDLDAGVWREEGVGVIVPATDRPGELAWVADVAHFTWWNCDEPWTSHACILITVHKNGVPLKGVQVQVKGDWGESAPQITDDDGEACTAMLKGAEGLVYVGDPNLPLIPPFPVQAADEPAACDGNGNACQTLPIDLGEDDKTECEPGASFACAYTGPPGSEGVGICKAGTNYCGVDGMWEGCAGEVVPEAEQPDTADDENCNGDPSDGLDADCPAENAVTACYDGPPGTLDVGECNPGIKTCKLVGNQLLWGDCTGADLPQPELCDTPLDEDCDGNPGCGLTTWTQSGGDVGAQVFTAVAVGAGGDVFVLGRFTGVLQLGAHVRDAGVDEHTFLAWFAPDGFVVDLEDLGPDLGGELEIAVRGQKQVFLAGTLAGPADAAGHFTWDVDCTADGSDAVDGLLLELDGTDCLHARRLGDADGPAIPSGLAVVGDRLHVAGAFGGTLETLHTDATEDDAFLLTFAVPDITQPPLFARQFGSTWPSYRPNRPALAASGAGLGLAFGFGGIIEVGQAQLVASASGSTLLARLDADGAPQWATVLADYTTLPTAGYGLVIDKQGALTVAADHGDGLLVSQWQSAAGYHWQSPVPDAHLPLPELGGARLAVTSTDRVVLNASRVVNGVPHAVFRKWTAGGVVDWTHVAGDPNVAAPTDGIAVAVSPLDQSTHVTGRMTGDIEVPGGSSLAIVEPGDVADGFLLKLQP